MGKNSATPAATIGALYVVATPIGNLGDISQRAILTLQSVDAILAEDTRHSSLLLHALGIQKSLFSLHAHNEHEKTEQLIKAMQQGRSYALISDAGTPLIRDPGFSLVREAQRQHIKVIPIPGASAVIAALSAAGVPCDSFTFAGFLPVKKQARVEQLTWLRSLGHTLVFYESTHRLCACLNDIANVWPNDYTLVLAKELTKIHECFVRGTAVEIQHWLSKDKARIKGEFVLLLPPLINKETESGDHKLLTVLVQELPLKQAVKIASQLSTTTKNKLYEMALKMTDDHC